MLMALPPGGAFDLAGALHELNDLDADAQRLEAQREERERTFRSETILRDNLRADLALAVADASEATARAHESNDPEAAARSRDATAREEAIRSKLASAEVSARHAEARLHEVEPEAVLAGEALERRIRQVAARLFVLTNSERLGRVRSLGDPSSAQSHVVPRWVGAMRTLTEWVDQDRTATAPTFDRDIRTMLRAWVELTPDRRRRVLDFVEDQRRLSAHETARQNGEKGGGVAMPSEDEPE
jgi:hypothetical protein